MSVIAVKITDSEINITADTRFTEGDERYGNTSKLYQHIDIVIGTVGMEEDHFLLIEYIKENYETFNKFKLLDFMCDFYSYSNKLRENLNLEDSEYKSSFILIVGNSVYNISHLLIQEVKDFVAIGSGILPALAALHLGHSAEEAVDVACKLINTCGMPSESITIKKSKLEKL